MHSTARAATTQAGILVIGDMEGSDHVCPRLTGRPKRRSFGRVDRRPWHDVNLLRVVEPALDLDLAVLQLRQLIQAAIQHAQKSPQHCRTHKTSKAPRGLHLEKDDYKFCLANSIIALSYHCAVNMAV